MKTCPTCNRTFEDSLRFCLEDGATLIRAQDSGVPTMTLPGQPGFQAPLPPTLVLETEPSMSTAASITHIFFAPARVFESFRDVITFTPAVVRFLVACGLLVIAAFAYKFVYVQRIGFENMNRAAIEASPRAAALPSEQKDTALRIQKNPLLVFVNSFSYFGGPIFFLIASLFLGALIYMLAVSMISGKISYLQSLLVWTYSSLPPAVLWLLVNTLVLLVWPPTSNFVIATGAGEGVIRLNLGALVDVQAFPVPVLAVVLGVFDILEFYGLGLAALGLRKVARVSWGAASAIVFTVWVLGVIRRVVLAAGVAAIMK